MTTGAGALWATVPGAILRLDASTGATRARIRGSFGRLPPPVTESPTDIGPIVFGAGKVWTVGPALGQNPHTDQTDVRTVVLYEIDPSINKVARSLDLLSGHFDDTFIPFTVAFAGGAVYAPAELPAWRLGAADERPTRMTPCPQFSFSGSCLIAFAAGREGLWAIRGDHTLVQLDPRDLHVLRAQHTLDASLVGVGGGAVWTADVDNGQLTELDPRDMHIVRKLDIAPGDLRLYVTGARSGSSTSAGQRSAASTRSAAIGCCTLTCGAVPTSSPWRGIACGCRSDRRTARSPPRRARR